jgi:hypothetical protein
MATPVHDEIGLLLLSRDAWVDPRLILNTWGRPGNTLFYMIPALGGLEAARVVSIFSAALTVLITTKVAQQLGVQRLFLIPALLWFQPWFADMSFAAVTEVPFSLFLILGVYCWLSKRWQLASVCLGLLPLIRHEGIVLLGAWMIYVLYQRHWRCALIGAAPFVGYNGIYYLLFHAPAFDIFFRPGRTPGGRAGMQLTWTRWIISRWLHFVPGLAYGIHVPVAVMGLIGLVPIWKRKERVLVFVLPVLHLLVHVILFAYGLYSTGGYLLFLLPLAPFTAVAAALGFEWGLGLISRTPGLAPRSTGVRIVATALYVFIVLVVGLRTVPRPPDVEIVSARQAAEWLRERNMVAKPVLATHVYFYYYYPLPVPGEKLWTILPPLDSVEIGTIALWDRHYSNRWGLHLAYLTDAKNGWEKLQEFGGGAMILFQKRTDMSGRISR